MARAKTTARAEARRRYRQTAAAEPEVLDAVDDAEAAPQGDTKPAAPAASARPGIGDAFRRAYRPAHFREDIEHLPRLLVSRAFLAGVALIVVGAVLVIAQPSGTLSAFAFQTLVLPPALAPVFVAGFFAPRASYLLGLFIGLIDAIVYSAVVAALLPQFAPDQDPTGQVAVAVLTSPLSGLLFASAAAWYRRFLQLSSPRAQQRAAARPGAKPTRSDGRTRSGAAKR